MNNWARALLPIGVFLCGVSSDFFWVFWINSVQSNLKILACLCSVSVGLVSLASVSAIISGRKLLIAAWLIGLGVGTYLAMSLHLIGG